MISKRFQNSEIQNVAAVPVDVGILVATTTGLVAISLDTLSAAVISLPEPLTVAFDTKTGKAIWSERGSIKRAYPHCNYKLLELPKKVELAL